ncbi:MAG: MoaD/ThiS family protein [Myxococcota bacterium]
MITVTVRHFAAMREARGCSEESVEIAKGSTIAQVYASLFDGQAAGPVAFLRNRSQVQADQIVENGDELAFLPPFGGG